MFSGSQSHRGRSQNPVAWIASVEETKPMKPIDKALVRRVSKSPGRNVSEPTGGLVNFQPRRPSPLLTGEGSMAYRTLTDATRHSGGVVGAAR
jgi:hypothetical protein